uniref:DNA processing chain A n=1 Tax=Pseudomonas phage Arace01 TaxID=3138526 RepID=A0AAU6VZE9_9VIRU
MPKQKMIVAGGRDFIDHERMLAEFNNLVASGFMAPDCELVCGMARGADMTAYHIFRAHNNPVHVFHPDWDAEPKRAGFIRNAEMGDFADACIAFWDGQSKGTKHMIDYMQRLDKPLTVIRY